MGCRASKSALCREYGVSRPTGNKWITRYQAGQQLEDRRRRPIQSPGKTPA
ncbi:MAG: helix-turn-helix domain-containing protein [Oscillospiraceae bacterium]|nr:helix-turn-helix domain-containing protein [Oscillospiraceae bacterium]